MGLLLGIELSLCEGLAGEFDVAGGAARDENVDVLAVFGYLGVGVYFALELLKCGHGPLQLIKVGFLHALHRADMDDARGVEAQTAQQVVLDATDK